VDIFIKEGKTETLLQLCGFRLDVQDSLKKNIDIVVKGCAAYIEKILPSRPKEYVYKVWIYLAA